MEVDLEEQLIDSMTVTDQRSIKRCVQQISSVQQGSVPFARDMGVEEFLPINNSPYVKNEFAAAVEMQIEEWETRATPSEVSFDDDGNLKVVMELNGE